MKLKFYYFPFVCLFLTWSGCTSLNLDTSDDVADSQVLPETVTSNSEIMVPGGQDVPNSTSIENNNTTTLDGEANSQVEEEKKPSKKKDKKDQEENPQSAAPNLYVKSSGSKLLLDNKEYRFIGTNVFYLMIASDEERDDILTYLANECGVRVIRMWGAKYLIGYWGLETEEIIGKLKAIFDTVKNKNLDLRFIVSLHDFPTNLCRTPETGVMDRCDPLKPEYIFNWFSGLYKETDSGNLNYFDHIKKVVGALRNRPEILAFELMNEPHCIGYAPCTEKLYNFNQEVSGVIKELSPNHIVTSGMFGAEHPGESFNNGEYQKIHSINTLDLTSLHYYNNKDNNIENGLKLIRWARDNNHPSFVGELADEFNKCGTECGNDGHARANSIKSMTENFMNNGSNGVLYWMYGERGDVFTFKKGDPMCGALKELSGKYR